MRKLIIIVGVVVLAVVAIYLSRGMFPKSDFGNGSPTSQDAADAVALTPEEIADAEATKAAIQSNPAPARYTNDKYGFSFNKPEGYTVGALPSEGNGLTLIVQRSNTEKTDPCSSVSSSVSICGFQIVITPLDAPMELTPNVIKSELPGTSVNSPLAINLDNKAKGMMFSSNNENFGGKSFEIWFVAPGVIASDGAAIQGYLYQITSYAEFSATLQQIIGTWKFK